MGLIFRGSSLILNHLPPGTIPFSGHRAKGSRSIGWMGCMWGWGWGSTRVKRLLFIHEDLLINTVFECYPICLSTFFFWTPGIKNLKAQGLEEIAVV